VNTCLEDITARRSLAWVNAIARLRRAKVCEVSPGQFYVFEIDSPGNRFPLVGSVPLKSLVNYFETYERTEL
jgi:hypothetical protein